MGCLEENESEEKICKISSLFSLTIPQTKLVGDTIVSLVCILGTCKKKKLAFVSSAVDYLVVVVVEP